LSVALLFDTSVLVALLNNERVPSMRGLETKKAAISIITFVETCRYYHANGKAREWNEAKSFFADMSVLPLTKEIGEKAAILSASKGLPLADALIYATALQNGMALATLDNHFRGLKNTLVLK